MCTIRLISPLQSLVSAFKRVFVDVGVKIPGVHNAFAESAVLNAIDPGDELRHIENVSRAALLLTL